jgi:hypothetical protein
VGYYLDKGRSLEDAMIGSEDYSEYTKDRFFACRRLGMNLDGPVRRGRIRAVYQGKNTDRHGARYWIPFVQRDYVRGIASNRVPDRYFANSEYALRFAELMGFTAAPNLIVGRGSGKLDVYFDDGDEVVIDDGYGLPLDITVTHHTGSFWHYRSPLVAFAAAYARPVNSRLALLDDPQQFADAYVDALITHFQHLQNEYRANRPAFDSLFNFRKIDPNGNFAHRWNCILNRLDRTDADTLREAIVREIHLP